MKPIKLNPDIKGFKDTERGKPMKPRIYKLKEILTNVPYIFEELPINTDLVKLEDVIQMIEKNYRDCGYTLNEGKMNKRPESWIENFKGRMDELVILYSELLDITNK